MSTNRPFELAENRPQNGGFHLRTRGETLVIASLSNQRLWKISREIIQDLGYGNELGDDPDTSEGEALSDVAEDDDTDPETESKDDSSSDQIDAEEIRSLQRKRQK